MNGVLLASPHERAWREALQSFGDPRRSTTAMYQAEVAGKLRTDGARAGLEALGVPDAGRQAPAYARSKQARLEELIRAGAVEAFPDGLRFVRAVQALGWPMAVASSSKNADQMMRPVRLASGEALLDAFGANVCSLALRRGKPDPEIFLLAAAELRVAPAHCFVAEDAPAEVEAARAGGMAAPGLLGCLLLATADPAWIIAENGCDPSREGTHASRFAISNGLMGVRDGGAINREACWSMRQRTA